MVKRVTDMQLRLAQDQGKVVTRPPMKVEFPELINLIEHFQQMKREFAEKHEKKWEQKLERLDKLIAAVEKSGGGEVAKALAKIQKEHNAMAAEAKALKSMAHTHKPCSYKVTGKRDQRGLIDLEAGLTFTVID